MIRDSVPETILQSHNLSQEDGHATIKDYEVAALALLGLEFSSRSPRLICD